MNSPNYANNINIRTSISRKGYQLDSLKLSSAMANKLNSTQKTVNFHTKTQTFGERMDLIFEAVKEANQNLGYVEDPQILFQSLKNIKQYIAKNNINVTDHKNLVNEIIKHAGPKKSDNSSFNIQQDNEPYLVSISSQKKIIQNKKQNYLDIINQNQVLKDLSPNLKQKKKRRKLKKNEDYEHVTKNQNVIGVKTPKNEKYTNYLVNNEKDIKELAKNNNFNFFQKIEKKVEKIETSRSDNRSIKDCENPENFFDHRETSISIDTNLMQKFSEKTSVNENTLETENFQPDFDERHEYILNCEYRKKYINKVLLNKDIGSTNFFPFVKHEQNGYKKYTLDFKKHRPKSAEKIGNEFVKNLNKKDIRINFISQKNLSEQRLLNIEFDESPLIQKQSKSFKIRKIPKKPNFTQKISSGVGAPINNSDFHMNRRKTIKEVGRTITEIKESFHDVTLEDDFLLKDDKVLRMFGMKQISKQNQFKYDFLEGQHASQCHDNIESEKSKSSLNFDMQSQKTLKDFNSTKDKFVKSNIIGNQRCYLSKSSVIRERKNHFAIRHSFSPLGEANHIDNVKVEGLKKHSVFRESGVHNFRIDKNPNTTSNFMSENVLGRSNHKIDKTFTNFAEALIPKKNKKICLNKTSYNKRENNRIFSPIKTDQNTLLIPILKSEQMIQKLKSNFYKDYDDSQFYKNDDDSQFYKSDDAPTQKARDDLAFIESIHKPLSIKNLTKEERKTMKAKNGQKYSVKFEESVKEIHLQNTKNVAQKTRNKTLDPMPQKSAFLSTKSPQNYSNGCNPTTNKIRKKSGFYGRKLSIN